MSQACQYCCQEGPDLFKQKNIKFCIPKCGRVLTCERVCGLKKPVPEDTHDTKCTLCGGEPVKKQEKKQVEFIRSSFRNVIPVEQITSTLATQQVITQEPEIHETSCLKCRGDAEKIQKVKRRCKKKKEPSIVEVTTCQLCTGDVEKKKKKRRHRRVRESQDSYDDLSEEQSDLFDGAQFSTDCSEFYDVDFYRRYFKRKKQMADEKIEHRKLWKKQQVKLRIHVEKMIAQNTGPDWFQDLSNLQMKLIDSIPETIEEDHQKSSVRGTQVLLYEFGIYPQLCSKLLKLCMLESEADPIKFLFLVHREVVILETEDYEREYFQAKQFGRKISPFSLNERLLLSGVFHVHFDTFLKKLDDILPPGYKSPKILLGKKPVKPKKKLPSCPYLQPQPINEKSWIEERAEGDLEKKILRDMKFREEITRREKFKKEMDLKERERKFQEETDELIQRAHSAEMKGMLNPQSPSKDSLVKKGKPMREQKNIVVQRMYPYEELTEEEDEQEVSTGIPRLDRLLKYQEISPKLSARFENQKKVYREKINVFKAKYEDIEKLAAEEVSVRSETSSDSDDDSFSDDEEDDSDGDDDDEVDGVINPSVDGSGEESKDEDEFPDDNVEAIEQSLEELTQKPQSLLDESEVFRKIGKVREEASKESISEMETEEQSSEDVDDTEWSTVLSYKTSMEKFIDDLRADEVTVKSVVFSESDSMIDDKPKKPVIQLEEEEIGEEEMQEEEEQEEEEDESSLQSDHINVDAFSEIRFSDIWGVEEESDEECFEEDESDSEGSDEEDGGGDDASEAEDHKKPTRTPKRGVRGEKSEMDDLKKTDSATSKVDSELEEVKEESFEEELLDEEEASSPTPSTVEEEEEEVVVEKELEKKVEKPPEEVQKPEETDEQKETVVEQVTVAEAEKPVESESEEESEEVESELVETEMMEGETLTEITEEISEESEEKREKSYEYVMMEGAYRLNWLDKQNIVQIITGKVVNVDTSPQLLPVKAFPDVPDCELFFELEDGIANDYECGFKKSRASQTDPTEILCDLKDIIRPFKKRRTILHIDYVDQHIDLQAIIEGQENLEKEKEGELVEMTTITEVVLDQQIPPKHMTSGYDDMELQLDPETGEVIRDLEEEEKKRIEAENELEKELQSRVIDLLSEEVVSEPSEIFQAGKGVIEIDRARIKAALPPPHESPSTTEQEDEAENRKKQKELDEAAEKECIFSHKPLTVECLERDCALIDESELPMNEYTLARRMLAALPEEERLKAAIKYLADKGDPLAILPDIHRVPWLTRWYEKRRGIRLKLTPKDNQNLMNQSTVQWFAQYESVDKIPLKTIEKSNLTWNNIEWVRKRSAQILDKYHYALKAVLVTNARNYFPTMFCEYYGNPYMRRFRDIFFTYLPGRPNDAYTLRPWSKAIKSTET